MTKYFYSLYNWNEAPTQTTGSFKLQDASLKPHWVQESNGKWRYKKGNSYVKKVCSFAVYSFERTRLQARIASRTQLVEAAQVCSFGSASFFS